MSSEHPDTDHGVDAALLRLDGLAERPVDEHVEIFDDVHQLLLDRLSSPSQPG